MKLPGYKLFIMLTAFLSLCTISAIAQDNAAAKAPVAEAAAMPQAKEVAIYGEVQSVNVSAGTISVQYYDYDSDSEKTTEIMVTDISKLENVVKLADIKKSDWVDVTYVVDDGKSIAKVVTVEREEVPATEEAPAAPASDTSEGQ